ncbi:hypothetical protein BDR06DRAFT_970500 [Suillus hirtellus]|nr:hypothetical protein BDR06DRAFT_970500 [Suillus hirtellus]
MCPLYNKGWPPYDNMQAILGENSSARGRHAFYSTTTASTSISIDDVLDGTDRGLNILGTPWCPHIYPSHYSPVINSPTFNNIGALHSGMSNAARVTMKITPVAAIINMQGSINHLTDTIKNSLVQQIEMVPPVPSPPAPPIIISYSLTIMCSADADLGVEQRATLLQIFTCVGGENNLAAYVKLEDDFEMCHAFISGLFDQEQCIGAIEYEYESGKELVEPGTMYESEKELVGLRTVYESEKELVKLRMMYESEKEFAGLGTNQK